MNLKTFANLNLVNHSLKKTQNLLKLILFAHIFFIAQTLSAAENVFLSRSKMVEGRFLLEYETIAPETENLEGAISLKLKSGWHIYWKNPGSVGLPPKSTWVLPSHWSATPLQFPAPTRFVDSKNIQADSFGYMESVTFPFSLSGPAIDRGSLKAEVQIEFLICEEQCIPDEISLSRKINISKEITSLQKRLITDAKSHLPRKYDAADGSVSIEWKDQHQRAHLSFQDTLGEVSDVFIDIPMLSSDQKSVLKNIKTEYEGNNRFDIIFSEPVKTFEWTALVKKGDQKFAITGAAPRSNMMASILSAEFFIALFFALLGGLILNLMPCVLPVLALKTVSLLEVVQNKRTSKAHLLVTSSGIWASFLGLAVITLILQKTGANVGWGFQFQNSNFILFMIFLIFFFSLNLFDLFQLELPSSTSTRLANSRGPFLEGVFATLLATPCSAPFLGTALTYALSQPPAILVIFYLTMGLGLSLPYLLFFFVPSTLKFLPKPGRWMHQIKYLLGCSLLFAILWLMYVLLRQVSSLALLGILASLISIFLVMREIKHPLRWVLAIFISLGTFYFISESKSETQVILENKFTPFSETWIQDQLSQKKNLFIVVTADWCLTCKYNEKLILETEWFRNLLLSQNTEFIIFDWTQKNSEIDMFLKKHGRVGIPFSMLINSNEEVVLPELLSRKNVEDAFKVLK